MHFVSDPGFWIRLLEIGFLNLLLSGDNAVLIALAVRSLPKRQRVLGQIWGTLGAIVLRLAFVGIVSRLLEVAFLRAAGALVLLWIAYKLVQPEGAELRAHLSEGLRQVRAGTGSGSVCTVVEVAPWSRLPEQRALLVPRDD